MKCVIFCVFNHTYVYILQLVSSNLYLVRCNVFIILILQVECKIPLDLNILNFLSHFTLICFFFFFNTNRLVFKSDSDKHNTSYFRAYLIVFYSCDTIIIKKQTISVTVKYHFLR